MEDDNNHERIVIVRKIKQTDNEAIHKAEKPTLSGGVVASPLGSSFMVF
jgi:hypothetical protein